MDLNFGFAYTSYVIPFLANVKFVLNPAFDNVNTNDIENPIIDGFPLSSYSFIIFDITDNTNDNIEKIKRAEYKFAYLENQSPALQQSIKAVPTVVIYKDGKPVGVFEGDLTMTLRVRLEDIQAVVDKYID